MLDNRRVRTQIISDESMAHRLVLPDRMLSRTSRDKVWALVFNNRKRLKEVSDFISKSGTLAGIPRKMSRSLDPEALIGGLFSSREARYELFGENLQFDYGSWVLLIKSCHDRLSKRMAAEGLASLDFNYGLYDINLDESRSKDREFLKTLTLYAVEDNYSKLTFEDKDLADFVVNTTLCEIGDMQFILDFMEKYPWLKERNLQLMEGVQNELEESRREEAGDGASARPDCGTKFESFLMNHLREIGSNMAPGRRMSLGSLVSISTMAYDLINHHDYGIPVQLQECLSFQQSSLVEYIKASLDLASATPGFVGDATFLKCLVFMNEPIREFTVTTCTQKVIDVLKIYSSDMSKFSDSISEHPHALDKELAVFKRLKEDVATEASKEDMDIEALVQKTTDLKMSSDHLHQTAEKVSKLFLGILEGFSQLHIDLAAAQAITEPVPAKNDEVPVQESSQVTDKINEELASATDAISTLERKNQDLTGLLDATKKENHTLKLRLSSSQEASETVQPALLIDQSTLLALMGRSRNVTPLEVLMAFKAIAPDRLEILPSAIDSAKAADNFTLGSRLASLMEKLVFHYLDAITEGKPDTVARKIFSQAYAAKESEGVVSNKRLRAMREFTYNNEKYLFLQHLSVGRNYGTQHAINLYFKVIDAKIIIGHCGEHLEVMGTN